MACQVARCEATLCDMTATETHLSLLVYIVYKVAVNEKETYHQQPNQNEKAGITKRDICWISRRPDDERSTRGLRADADP